ncbi:tRNA-splicing endonuclease subunit Sen15 [Aplysia californica]|uniref:tRNA-splicing endonuclease subunit Sen15 n=1 Tax=Aplysia californica TaxID=6500 RepID=A0ABM1VQQ5_APLCA|nr:tRNA-splicing endonuclease subunit Sen15 [Aplysia californica]
MYTVAMSVLPSHGPSRHPILEDFLRLYPSCDEDLADRVFLIYQDLTEVRGWWYTELAYSDTLGRPFVIGKRNRQTPRQAVLPLGSEETISLVEAQHMFSGIMIDGEPQKIITLAILDLDSTTVYYKLTSGLCPPDAPEVVTARKQDRDRKADRKRRHIAKCVREANERLADGGGTS